MENPLHPNRKTVIAVLLKGKKSATQLQTLLRNLSCGSQDSHLLPELTLQIMGSLSEAVSQLKNGLPPPQILADSADSGGRNWGHSGKKPAKARRGCYNRRKCSDTRINVSNTKEDGGAWRKYGQKQILNSKYPRCYFRCTHKHSQGCKATKQVQQISEDEYKSMYFGHHTCKGSFRAPVLIKSMSDDHFPMTMTTEDSTHSQSFECITQDGDYSCDVIVNQEDQCLITSGSSSGTNILDVVDDSCFANLGNLIQLEEMRPLNF